MSDEVVEVSKQQYEALNNAYSMLNKLYNHPDKAMEFKKLAKEAGYKVPELDTIERVTKPYDEKMSALEKNYKDLEEKYNKRDLADREKEEERALRIELDSVQKKEGLSDEGMNKVIARLMEKKSSDVEAAAAWVKSQEPKPKLTTNTHNFAAGKFDGAKWAGGGEEGEKAWKTLMKDGATGSDDYFASVVDDVLNHPENSREFGGNA